MHTTLLEWWSCRFRVLIVVTTLFCWMSFTIVAAAVFSVEFAVRIAVFIVIGVIDVVGVALLGMAMFIVTGLLDFVDSSYSWQCELITIVVVEVVIVFPS